MKHKTQLIMAIGLAAISLLVILTSLSGLALAANQCATPGGGGGCLASIQAAIDAAASGDTVRVVAGTYTENIVITKNLTLLGGFDDTSLTTRTPRSSIINGGGANTVIKISNNAVVTLDGFTITGGDGTVNNGEGGGIHAQEATVNIINNRIESNIASTNPLTEGEGGGIYVITGTALISGNTIQNNIAYSVTTGSKSGYGGGVCVADASSATILNNQILSNIAAQALLTGNGWGFGGGLDWWGEAITVTGNTIQGNWGSAVSGQGYAGGLGLWGKTALVANNTIRQNQAANDAPYAGGGGIYATAQLQQFTLTGNQILSNTAVTTAASTASPQSTSVWGGGLTLQGRNVVNDRFIMENNHIIGNIAAQKLDATGSGSSGTAQGGGVWIRYISSTTLISNEIRANVAVDSLTLTGGGSDGWGEAAGGGLYLRDSNVVTISNNQIQDNIAARQQTMDETNPGSAGGGLKLQDTTWASISDNIISGNITIITGSLTSNNGEGWWPRGGINLDCGNGKACKFTLTGNDILNNIAAQSLILAGSNVKGSNLSSGLWADGSTLTSTNNIFAGNTSGGIGVGSGQAKIINDTFYNNGSTGVGANGAGTTVYVTNTIIFSHTSGLNGDQASGSTTLRCDYCLLNNTNNYVDGATIGPNNIFDVNPLFVNAAANDFHLTATSPAIDRGTTVGAPAIDFEGDIRPQGNGVDIGADESPFQSKRVYLPIVLK